VLQSRAEALIPLTVKQINESLLNTSDKFNCVIDGVDVNNVSVAMRIRGFAFVINDLNLMCEIEFGFLW